MSVKFIDRTERVHVDTGLVAVTTKQIYFSGADTAFRIPYPKIVSFEPFSNGLGILKDGASAKPQVFVTHDGWFTYNLVTKPGFDIPGPEAPSILLKESLAFGDEA